MKKLLVTMVGLLTILGFASSASAAVLTFDDITNTEVADIFNGYGGFNWQAPQTNSIAMSKDYGYPGLDAMQGVTSGDYAAVTNFSYEPGDSFIITSSTSSLFDFNSAQFASLDFAQNNISIKGYLGGVLQNEDSFDVTNSSVFYYNGGDKFFGIDQLVISSTLDTSGDWIAMDDFTYNESAPAPAPEPSSMVLGLMGLGSMLGFRRKTA